MNDDSSFADLMGRLRAGDEDAAARVFDSFARRLVELARQHLDGRLRQKVDPEDVVQSAYRSFFVRYRDGQFTLLSWDSLWGVLTRITVRKCVNRAEHFRAARRDVRREVPLEPTPGEIAAVGQFFAHEPTPVEAAALAETVEHLMSDLDEREREMLALALQGYIPREISPRVGRSERTVQRLLDRVRKHLSLLQAEGA
jgi:RNA polymerase sigma-70 factor (ECF subfamily)